MCKYFMPSRNQNLCFRNYISKWNFFKSNHVLKSTQLNSVITVEVYIYMCKCVCAIVSVMSNCSRPYVLQPISLFCPWFSPSKNTGVGCHFPLEPTMHLLNLQAGSGNPIYAYVYIYLLHMCNFCWMLYYCLKCLYFQVFYEKFLDLKKILNPKLLKRLIYVFENYFTYTLYLNSIQYYKI